MPARRLLIAGAAVLAVGAASGVAGLALRDDAHDNDRLHAAVESWLAAGGELPVPLDDLVPEHLAAPYRYRSAHHGAQEVIVLPDRESGWVLRTHENTFTTCLSRPDAPAWHCFYDG